MLKALLAAVVVGTWNGNWFPSGRAEHRAHPDVEAATIKAVGAMLRGGIDALDPAGTNDLVLCFNEIRGPRVARELCSAIGRTNLSVAVVTGYRRRDRFDQQQDVIMTTLPVAEASWSLWKSSKGVRPPRGYAMAKVVVAPAVTSTVYAVHLKSNYGATTDELRAANREKRRLPIEQLVEMESPGKSRKKDAPLERGPAIIAGDFNADRWRREFAGETIFARLEEAGFENVLALLPEGSRGTHPNRRWGDSALDYIYVRGLEVKGPPSILPAGDLSDHQPVFALVDVP
jgi:endonuclease/exonuclease/phosphatase family metal-dependent hydrolase